MEDERKLVPVVRSVLDVCNEVKIFRDLSDHEKFTVLFAAAEFYRKCSMNSKSSQI